MRYNEAEMSPACDTVACAPESQIESDMRALDRTLDRIYDGLGNLSSRLQPLLPPPSPEVDKAPSNEGSAPMRCELANKLLHMNRVAERAHAHIATLLNTLQV